MPKKKTRKRKSVKAWRSAEVAGEAEKAYLVSLFPRSETSQSKAVWLLNELTENDGEIYYSDLKKDDDNPQLLDYVIKGLVEGGLIEKKKDDEDRRFIVLALSPRAGATTMDRGIDLQLAYKLRRRGLKLEPRIPYEE